MGIVVLGVALPQRPIGRDPIDLRRVTVPAVEQRRGTARFDRAVQAPEGFGAVHPWNERPMVTGWNRPSAGDKTKELPGRS